jgi:hypothetical protein
MISAVTVVELIYLVATGTFSLANVEAFYEILDATDSGFESCQSMVVWLVPSAASLAPR